MDTENVARQIVKSVIEKLDESDLTASDYWAVPDFGPWIESVVYECIENVKTILDENI